MTLNSMTETDLVLIERPAPGIAVVRLNRPRSLNALSMAMRSALVTVFRSLSDQDDVTVVILTGEGRGFCAGLDLKELGRTRGALTSDERVNPIHAIRAFPGAVIGALNGPAYAGGLELALACDILVAGRSASFADTHLKVGALPGWELSQRLSRTVGPYRAKKMSFSGEAIDAETAAAWGMVSEVVDDDAVLDRSFAIAQAIAQADRAAVCRYKKIIEEGYKHSLQEGILFERVMSAEHNQAVDEEQLLNRTHGILTA